MFLTTKKVLAVAITVMSMSSMIQADGKAAYAAGGCAGCHGANGKSIVPIYPHLAGQQATYIVKQLKDFQSGACKDPTMTATAALAKGKEQMIADWLSKQ